MPPWEKYSAPAAKPWERYSEPVRSGAEQATDDMSTEDRLIAAIGHGVQSSVQGAGQLGLKGMNAGALSGVDLIPGVGNMLRGAGSIARMMGVDTQQAEVDAKEKIAADKELFDQGLGKTTSGKIGNIAGAVLTTLPMGGAGLAPRGASFLGKVGAGAATGGAVTGLTTPVGEGDFITEKGKQVALGSIFGAVGTAALHAAGAGGKLTMGAVKSVAEKLKSIMPAVSTEARERAAASIIQKAASDPQTLAKAANPQQIVQGTQQHLAEAVQDPGISGLNRTLQSMSPDYASRLATMETQNNAARVGAIRNAFGGAEESGARAIEQARDAQVAPLLAAAKKVKGVDTSPVLSLADQIIKDRAGRPAVQSAVQKVRDLLSEPGMDEVQKLHNVRQTIGDMLSGSAGAESDAARAASRELLAIKRRLDVQVGKSSPEFKQFLAQYADMSKEAGQVRMGDELLGKSLAAIDANGNPILSPAKFAGAAKDLDRVARTATGFRKETADRLMTPNQQQTIGAVRSDLDRLARVRDQGRAPGSPTVQNATGAGRVQDQLGGSEVTSILAPQMTMGLNLFNGLKKRYGQKVLESVQEAMLNPAEASRILSKLPQSQQSAAMSMMGNPVAMKFMQSLVPSGSQQLTQEVM